MCRSHAFFPCIHKAVKFVEGAYTVSASAVTDASEDAHARPLARCCAAIHHGSWHAVAAAGASGARV
eukprot:364604-Chlamydomonas_euryale.AAC.9